MLTPHSVQQWGASAIETRWLAQETEPGTGHQRSVTVVDVALPTYEQCQFVSRAARRAFMSKHSSTLLHAFLEQKHCLFVFADDLRGSLQERMDRQHLLSEAEAMTCLQDLARAMVRLSQLEPPIMHGWICPAHVVQRGTQWHLRPEVDSLRARPRVLQPSRFLSDWAMAPFRRATTCSPHFKLCMRALTGLMPPPSSGNQGLPSSCPAGVGVLCSASRARAARRVPHANRPSSSIRGSGDDDPPHPRPRFSGPLTPHHLLALEDHHHVSSTGPMSW